MKTSGEQRARSRKYYREHRDERLIKNAARKELNKERYEVAAKRWREANKAHLREYMAEWRAANRQKLRDWHANYRATHPKSWRDRVLRKKYGFGVREYNDMVIGQAGRCLICFRVPPEDLVVDHDHQTGKVRGLLCQRCNRMLGHVDDNPRTLRHAMNYLEAA